jgi:hypothetical protein
MTEVGDRYRRRADAFEGLITCTAPERWTSPSPCVGWLARDVVAHVVDYSGHVLRETASMSAVPTFADFDDPAAAFRAIRQLVERVLDDQATPPDLANYLDLAVSFDLPQHGWDLAKATFQDPTIDPKEVGLLWSSLLRARRCGTGSARTVGTPPQFPFRATLRSRIACSDSSAAILVGRQRLEPRAPWRASAYLPIGCGSRQRSVAPGCASGSAPERAICARVECRGAVIA